MLVADFARTALQLTAAALLISGAAEIWHLVALQVGMGVSEAFFRPSYTGLVPDVVSPLRLQQANALQGVVMSGSVTFGAFLAGMFVAAFGAGWAIGIDGLSYIVSAAFLWRLRPEGYRGGSEMVAGSAQASAGEASAGEAAAGKAAAGKAAMTGEEAPAGEAAAAGRVPAAGRLGFLRDLGAGWREFTSHTWLWVMVVGISVFFFAFEGPAQVLGPIVARDAYDGARTWGFISGSMGIGQITGGLLSLLWRPRRPMLVLAAGLSLAALPMAMLAMKAPVWALYGSFAVIGVEWGLYDPFWTTCMQREVAPALISRVSSYGYFGALAFYPAGLALAGPLADAFGISTVLWVSVGVAILVSVFALAWRDVRAPHELAPARPSGDV